MLSLLFETCRNRGKTLILVTHDRQALPPADAVIDFRAATDDAFEWSATNARP